MKEIDYNAPVRINKLMTRDGTVYKNCEIERFITVPIGFLAVKPIGSLELYFIRLSEIVGFSIPEEDGLKIGGQYPIERVGNETTRKDF